MHATMRLSFALTSDVIAPIQGALASHPLIEA